MKYRLHVEKKPAGEYYSYRSSHRVNGKPKSPRVYLGVKKIAEKLMTDFSTRNGDKQTVYSYTGEKILSKISDQLNFAKIIDGCVDRDTECSVGQFMEILVIERALFPYSKWALANDIHQNSIFSKDSLIPADFFNEDNIYNYMDYVYPNIHKIQNKLIDSLEKNFSIDFDELILDATSTYFYIEDDDSGDGKNDSKDVESPFVTEGYNRDKKRDVKQVNIMLGTNKDYIPLYFETYPGNTVDLKMFKESLSKLENDYKSLLKRVKNKYLVMDCGNIGDTEIKTIGDLDNFCDKHGSKFIAGMRKSKVSGELSKLKTTEDDLIYEHEDTKIYGKTIEKDVYGRKRKILLYHNPKISYGAKIDFKERVRLTKDKIKEINKENIDVKEKKSKIHQLLSDQKIISLFELKEELKNVEYKFKRGNYLKRLNKFGKFAIFSNNLTLSAEDIIRVYKTKSVVEHEFRTIKNVLDLRPINHKKPERIKTHIAIVFWGMMHVSLLRLTLKRKNVTLSFERMICIIKKGELCVDEYIYEYLHRKYTKTNLIKIDDPLKTIMDFMDIETDCFKIEVSTTKSLESDQKRRYIRA